MRPFYPLILFLFLPLFSIAQSSKPLYLLAEVGVNSFHVKRFYNYTVYGSSIRSSNSFSHNGGGASGLAGSIGLGYQLHPRWQVEGTIAYGRGQVRDTVSTSDFPGNGLDEIVPVKVRGVWSTLRLTYQIQRYPSRWKWVAHMGINYGGVRYNYLSGFTYDITRGIYDVRRTTESRFVSWGIPIGVRGEYTLYNGIRLGLSTQANLFFDGYQQTSITGFVALPIGG